MLHKSKVRQTKMRKDIENLINESEIQQQARLLENHNINKLSSNLHPSQQNEDAQSSSLTHHTIQSRKINGIDPMRLHKTSNPQKDQL